MSILKQEGNSDKIKILDEEAGEDNVLRDESSLEIWQESTIHAESKQTILNSPGDELFFTPPVSHISLVSEQLARQIRENIEKEKRRFNQQCEMLKVKIATILNEYDESRIRTNEQ
jgi:hypothetical protein